MKENSKFKWIKRITVFVVIAIGPIIYHNVVSDIPYRGYSLSQCHFIGTLCVFYYYSGIFVAGSVYYLKKWTFTPREIVEIIPVNTDAPSGPLTIGLIKYCPLPGDGKILAYSIQDGQIKGLDGIRKVDFVIDANGKLVIGYKHDFLGNARDVRAAGQLKLDGKGRIRRIDNLAAHYPSTSCEVRNYPGLFKHCGLNVKNAWLEIYKITVDNSGLIVSISKSSEKIM